MKKEQYLVKCPERIRFGDPMCFERYSEEELSRLVVDYYPSAGFEARVVLSESEVEELPGCMDRSLTIYMAPGHMIDTYVEGYMLLPVTSNRRQMAGIPGGCLPRAYGCTAAGITS